MATPQRNRVTVLATHPIQYHAPWFRALARRPEIELRVLFEHLPDARAQGRGFEQAFQWDVPLLEGYRWRSLTPPGTRRARFAGLRGLRRHLQVDSMSTPRFVVPGATYLLTRRCFGRRLLLVRARRELAPRPEDDQYTNAFAHVCAREWV